MCALNPMGEAACPGIELNRLLTALYFVLVFRKRSTGGELAVEIERSKQ